MSLAASSPSQTFLCTSPAVITCSCFQCPPCCHLRPVDLVSPGMCSSDPLLWFLSSPSGRSLILEPIVSSGGLVHCLFVPTCTFFRHSIYCRFTNTNPQRGRWGKKESRGLEEGNRLKNPRACSWLEGRCYAAPSIVYKCGLSGIRSSSSSRKARNLHFHVKTQFKKSWLLKQMLKLLKQPGQVWLSG